MAFQKSQRIDLAFAPLRKDSREVNDYGIRHPLSMPHEI
jgi:hypothetical protein